MLRDGTFKASAPLAGLVVLLMLVVIGCGSESSGPRVTVTGCSSFEIDDSVGRHSGCGTPEVESFDGFVSAEGCLHEVRISCADECISDVKWLGSDCDNAEPPPPPGAFLVETPAHQLDLLFVVDNSRSMADKQLMLQQALGPLLARLSRPDCIDGETGLSTQPSSDGTCPGGEAPQFKPLSDVHIAVVSSSLGDAGAMQACAGDPPDTDDAAHLLGSLARGASEGLEPLGFLAWDGSEGETIAGQLVDHLASLGTSGCEFEAPLEAMLRFLAEPAPYAGLSQVDCPGTTTPSCVAPDGVDEELLMQRSAFLRPESVVAVALLSDENDCSVRIGGQAWYALRATDDFRMYRATSVCDTDPNSPCCASCAQAAPAGCQPDPTCETDMGVPRLSVEEDAVGVRCWDMKRRFGIDFLYPIQRYVNALTKPNLCTARIDLGAEPQNDGRCLSADTGLLANPLLVQLNEDGEARRRNPGRVVLLGAVGVPWQLIQAQDTAQGAEYPEEELHFMRAEAMDDSVWERLLPGLNGDTDPHMVESIDPRAGVPGSEGGFFEDPMHGHEQVAVARDQLQLACAYPLPDARQLDCAEVEEGESCACSAADASFSPLCQAEDGSYASVQVADGATPGLRQLELLRQLGESGQVASICPRNTSDETAPDYGYLPVMNGLVDALAPRLQALCLPAQLPVDDDGRLDCALVQLTRDDACDCDAPGVGPVSSDLAATARKAAQGYGYCLGNQCDELCACQLQEASGANLAACLSDEPIDPDVGFCYIDPEAGSGEPEAVQHCPDVSKRRLRFGMPPSRDVLVWTDCVE